MATSLFLLAALKLVSPAQDATVCLLSDCQRKVVTNVTMAARTAALAKYRADDQNKRHSRRWRHPKEVVFEWIATEGEKGPWELVISKKPDLSDARVFLFHGDKPDSASGRHGEEKSDGLFRHVEKTLNLELATRYYWRVASDITCGRFSHSRICDCSDKRASVMSETGTFTTEDLAPRWLDIEGSVGNFRDLGGRRGLGGRRVRQGMIYRSQGLNYNSVDGVMRGSGRLTADDIEYLTRTLGIKTDLDLRTKCETAGMNGVSPLGPAVKFINNSSPAYVDCFKSGGMKTMAENFRVFCDRRNYPILFHCIGGADRTGALAYVLNGVLGVSRQGLETDWEATFYPSIPGDSETFGVKHVWNSAWHLPEGFSKYGREDSSWNERIELYLKDCGISDAELETFRAIMLEGYNGDVVEEVAPAGCAKAATWRVPSWDARLTASGFLNSHSYHVQGMCVSSNALYFTLYDQLAKTDWMGRALKSVTVPKHTGDICLWRGRLYTACCAERNDSSPDRGTIRMYDEDLNLLKERRLRRPADGITCIDGVLYVGLGPGGTKEAPYRGNWFGKFDAETLEPLCEPFRVDHGFDCCAGVQNMATDGDRLYVNVYTPDELAHTPCFIIFDRSFNVVSTHEFGWRQGMDVVPGGDADAVRFIYVTTVNWMNQPKGDSAPPVQALWQFAELKGGEIRDITRHCIYRKPWNRDEEDCGSALALSPACRLDGRLLAVTVPEGGESGMHAAHMTVKLADFADTGLDAMVLVRGEDVSVPADDWNGVKFMMHFKRASSGVERWPGARLPTGDFGWRVASLRIPADECRDGGEAELFLGLQDSSGTVVFNMSTLEITASRPLAPATNKDLVSSYTPDVSSMPVMRGVMSPARNMTEDDFCMLRSWGVTLLRYQMVRNWHGVDTNQDLEEFDRWLDGRLDHFDCFVLPQAAKAGIKVVLDMHVPPGGRDKTGDMNMFYEERYARHFVETWRRIARRFKGRDALYGYDLVNEPAQRRPTKPGMDYWSLQLKAAEAIRSEDPAVAIVVESNEWATSGEFANLSPMALDNVIYQVHMYDPIDYTHQRVMDRRMWTEAYPNAEKGWSAARMREVVKPVREFQLRHKARIYVGEFSAVCWAPGAENYLRDCIDMFESYGWDWSYHAFREWDGWSVEHAGADAKSLRPSPDNARRRALLDGFARGRSGGSCRNGKEDFKGGQR